jgi:hypothetical protein
MIVVTEVYFAISSFASEFELKEVEDSIVGLNDILLENWAELNDVDRRSAVRLNKLGDVRLVHGKLLNIFVLEKQRLNFCRKLKSVLSGLEDLDVSGWAADGENVKIGSVSGMKYHKTERIDVFKK